MKPPARDAPTHPFRVLGFGLCALAFLLEGCSTVSPEAATRAEVLSATETAARESQDAVPQLRGPLSLNEAIARALKHNLNQRAQLIEQSLAAGVWQAGSYDLLPRLTAGAAYNWRDSDLVTRSRDSVTGRPSLANPFISSDREALSSHVGLSWSVLDFSVGYYLSRQDANRVLMAGEHRRRAMHALTRDVAVAFWRMASAQALRGDVQKAIRLAREALADSSQVEAAALRAPEESLRFRRQLLENLRLLSNIERDFGVARVTLASLINVPLNTPFTVKEPDHAASIAILDVPIDQLEEAALLRNGELREQLYQQRIARDEVRKTIARLIPGLQFDYRVRQSSDSFLIHDAWQDAAITVSQNLTALVSAPTRLRLANGGVELERQRFVALQMALVAQLHVSRLELAASHEQLMLSGQIYEIDEALRRHAENRVTAATASKLSQVSAYTGSIVSRLRRYQSLADFQVASSTLQAALGLELDHASVDRADLDTLVLQLQAWQSSWSAGRLETAVAQEAPSRSTATRGSSNQ